MNWQVFWQCVLTRSLAASVALAALAGLIVPSGVLVSALGLGGLAGALLGAALGLCQAALRGLPARMLRASWLALGALVGLSLAQKLGAFNKLHGAHARFSLLTITGFLTLGLAAGLVLVLVQPDASGKLERLRSVRARVGLSILLAASGLASAVYEASAWWLHSYPPARRGLVGWAWLLTSAAVLLLIDALPKRQAFQRGLPLLWFGALAVAASVGLRAPPATLLLLTGGNHIEHVVALLRWASDWDRDGYSSLLGGGDCAPWNAHVHPNVREIPGNGIDDNCRYGDATIAPPLTVMTQMRALAPSPVNVLLITVDALRPDHTTAYGYERKTTPELERFAHGALRFDNAYTAGGWTCIALPALFAGVHARKLAFVPAALTKRQNIVLLPWQKRIERGDEFKIMLTVPAKAEHFTLQAALKQRGMRTAAVYNFNIRHLVRFLGPGFDSAEYPSGPDDADVAELALRRLASFGSDAFFMWIHLFDPHDPQTSHAGIPDFGSSLVDRYDHEVAASDAAIGRVIAAVEA
ncbi:MAG TPA: sulfatase-like hydrolase/transferase, partial [Polyangiaceae bacterium]|nr:sulfatase-like hydrolase/transferase [Polyangiaceae bacterium]